MPQNPVVSTTSMEWLPSLQVLIVVKILLMVFSKYNVLFTRDMLTARDRNLAVFASENTSSFVCDQDA